MSNSKYKVLFALSGGVDSTVGAKLLLEQGYSVTGINMLLTDNASNTKAQQAAEELNIPLEVLDLRSSFKNEIIQPFCYDYSCGLTPNPCVNCNRQFKFGYLEKYRIEHHFDYLATGHYVINQDGKIYKGLDTKKDQSYFLYQLNPDTIKHLLFPLGQLTKSQVRELAIKYGFSSSSIKDSLDICFIPNGNYSDLVETYYPSKQGLVFDENGTQIGKHFGISNFTIGQRHGFETKINSKLYVKSIDNQNNSITVSSFDALYTNTIRIHNLHLQTPIENETKIDIKIRYQSPLVNGIISYEKDAAVITTTEPVWAPTPGQSAVLYKGNLLLGGGIICNE